MTLVAETPADQVEPALELPTKPERERPTGFPYVMVFAPIVIAGVLYVLLRSPYVLIFAVFGPVMGIANVIDQRFGSRRRYRKALAAYDDQVGECLATARAAHARIRARARARSPLPGDIVAGAGCVSREVVLGTTTLPGELRVAGNNAQLAPRVSAVEGMPFGTEATHIVVLGEGLGLLSVARAAVVALLAADTAASLAVEGAALEVLREELRQAGVALVPLAEAERVVSSDALRGGTQAIVVNLAVAGDATLTDATGVGTRIRPAHLGAPQLLAWLPRVAVAQAERRRAETALPRSCRVEDLVQPDNRPGAAAFLLAPSGARPVDLVGDGPHAVIGGTTGSGKSELLVAWALALASAHTSEQLTMLCLDFKGGATFDPLARLPHCGGIVTDLDGDEALRVGESLRAEVHRRERWLREHGLRELPAEGTVGLTRLVIFVDEFQALIGTHPQLQELIADIGARGRSLGMHLVLCTQRPTGTFREELLANCSLRLCLRVEQVSDSHTLLGTAEAASIAAEDRGRAWLRIGGERTLVQVAIASPQLVERVARAENARLRQHGVAAPEPIWRPPLPSVLAPTPPSGLAADELWFGEVDLPERQQRLPATLRAGRQLFVLGASGCGRTGTLRMLERAAAGAGWETVWVPRDSEGAWDAVARLTAGERDKPRRRLVLLDDLDVIEQQFGDEHRATLLERVLLLLRGGAERGTSVAVSARRATGQLLRIQQQCDRTLRLAHVTRNDWILQGGEPADWRDNWPPGRGRLDRSLVQVALAPPATTQQEPAQRWRPFAVGHAPIAVVARRCLPIVRALEAAGLLAAAPPSASALREHGLGDANFVGDVEQWLGAYGSLTRVAEQRDVAMIGLTPGEWRSLFRADPLPPAVRDHGSRGLLRRPDGTVARLQLRDGVPIAVEQSAAVPVG